MPFVNGKGKMVRTGQRSAPTLGRREITWSTVIFHAGDPTSAHSGMSRPLRGTGTS